MPDSSPPPPTSGPDFVADALAYSVARVRDNLASLTSFPERTDGARWLTVNNGGWVGGHWVGLLWWSYHLTGDPALQGAARTWATRLLPRQTDTTTHDLGFLFELAFVLGATISGDDSLKAPAVTAAHTLARRFNPRGRYLQAWGPLDAAPEQRGRAIIDTMMNLDLLFWASRETGDPTLAAIAAAHADTARRRHVRPDGSTSHVTDFDPDTGAFLKQDTHQGLSASSCWSRGQAWAVYGFGECYRETGEPLYLETARRAADYALARLPADHVPYWDYDSPLIPDDVCDSSAASTLASALLELARLESDAVLAQRWRSAALAMLTSLWQAYTTRDAHEPSILRHGTRSKPHGMLDHGLIYGDYYFVEALLRV